MNTSVIYSSLSGHSKKIAESVAENLNIKAYNLKKTKPVLAQNVIFAAGIYADSYSQNVIDFISTLNSTEVKQFILVTSCARGKPNSDKIQNILKTANIELKEIVCPGGFLMIKFGHPNKEDIQKVIESCKSLVK